MEHRQSLRSFLDSLSKDEILDFRMKREDFLISALALELEKKEKFPVIRLTDPETGLVTVSNCFGTRDRLNRFIKNMDDIEMAAASFSEVCFTENAPVREVMETGDDINVLELPVFRHFEGDAGRYITSGIVITRDPDTHRCNFSFHRMMLQGSNRIGVSLHSHGDTWKNYNKAIESGKDLEAVVVIGAHPAYHITAASKIPDTQDDYSWVSAFMGETAEVIKAETVDIPVPAYAEYVIEGRISRTEFADEGPFGEYTGFSTDRSTRNVLVVTAVTHRKDPIYQDLVPGYAWEHLLLSQYTKEILLLQKLKKEIPEVKAINLPKDGCHFHAYVSLKQKAKGQAKQVALLLFGLDLYLKLVIVVDEDVDVYNEKEVLWAMATRVQADRDVFIVPGVICNRLDPSSEDNTSAKMGIDATEKSGEKLTKVMLPVETVNKARELLKTCE